MSELNRDIGARIKGVRDLNGLTREEFAKQLGISTELLAQYEGGSTEIPVSILHEISSKFDVSMTELLTGESAKLSVYSVVRKGKGVGIERRKDYDYKSLAYNFSDRKLDPYYITVEPKPEGEPVHMTSHSGHEFLYVLEGSVRVVVAKYETLLQEGDSIYYDSTYPHGIQAAGGKTARLLVTITGRD
ncbi:XRE family transcriptional regulator [Ruminococcaceae bacterium OttesenSCG-928-I18]|nr:XRE family transcriptional regulator [Ruminococcaceae bacterium OttesenSCG-928-I18]